MRRQGDVRALASRTPTGYEGRQPYRRNGGRRARDSPHASCGRDPHGSDITVVRCRYHPCLAKDPRCSSVQPCLSRDGPRRARPGLSRQAYAASRRLPRPAAPAPPAGAAQPAGPAAAGSGEARSRADAGSDWVKVCGQDQGNGKEICYTTRDFSHRGRPAAGDRARDLRHHGRRPVASFRLLTPVGLLLQARLPLSRSTRVRSSKGKFEICMPNGCFAETQDEGPARSTRLKKAHHA